MSDFHSILLKSMRDEAKAANKKLTAAKDRFDEAISNLIEAHSELASIEERIRITARLNPKIYQEKDASS